MIQSNYHVINSINNNGSDFTSSRPEVFCKKGFLKISPNSQEENTCTRPLFLIKLQALVPQRY